MWNYRTVNFFSFSIFAVFSVLLAMFAFSFGGVDFNVYYAAAKVTSQGGNPYDFQQLAPQIVLISGKINNPYYYAPWFTWMVLPFSLFSYPVARILWLIFHFILWLCALHNLTKVINYPQNDWRKWMIWLFVTFVFAWSTWGSEQVGILVFFLFTLILFFYQKENWLMMGTCLSLILFKPNLTALPVGAILIWLVFQRKQWQPLFVMAGTVLLMIVISLFTTPFWYLAFLQRDKLQGLSYTLDSAGIMEIQRYTTTLLDWLKVYGISGNLATCIYVVFILFGIFILIISLKHLKSLSEFIAVAVLINFALVPYTLFYDYSALVITLFSGYALFAKFQKNTWLPYLVNIAILVSLLAGGGISCRYWITIILIIFLGCAYYIKSKANNLTLI